MYPLVHLQHELAICNKESNECQQNQRHFLLFFDWVQEDLGFIMFVHRVKGTQFRWHLKCTILGAKASLLEVHLNLH